MDGGVNDSSFFAKEQWKQETIRYQQWGYSYVRGQKAVWQFFAAKKQEKTLVNFSQSNRKSRQRAEATN